MALQDEAVGLPLVAVDGNAYLAALGSLVVFDSDVTVTLVRSVRSSVSIEAFSGPLLIQWNVNARLLQPLPIDWNVVNPGLDVSIVIQWDVVSPIISLPIQWRVLPNFGPLFSADVQRPAAEVEEDP